MKQNDWTSKLHERLDGHKATVPDGLWDKIAERLDDNIATAPAPLPNNRNRHKTIRLVALAMSAAASVAVVVMVALRMNDDTINNVASKYNRPAPSLHNPAYIPHSIGYACIRAYGANTANGSTAGRSRTAIWGYYISLRMRDSSQRPANHNSS